MTMRWYFQSLMDCRKQRVQKLLLFSFQADTGCLQVAQVHNRRVEVKIMQRRYCSGSCFRLALKVCEGILFGDRAVSLRQ